jgi:phosphate transport system permease protein
MKLYTRRRLINGFNLTFAALAMLFGLFWLAWLLWTLFSNGFRWMDLALFT